MRPGGREASATVAAATTAAAADGGVAGMGGGSFPAAAAAAAAVKAGSVIGAGVLSRTQASHGGSSLGRQMHIPASSAPVAVSAAMPATAAAAAGTSAYV